MKESTIIILTTSFLLILGFVSIFFNSDFNFYKSNININNSEITETLNFKPDKSYHTLFRNFVDPLEVENQNLNSIKMKSISCSSGQEYIKLNSGECYNKQLTQSACQPYTENNEYGCTTGNSYGFFKNQEYTIKVKYNLNPSNIFVIDGNNYMKFVVYSPNHHKFLSSNFKAFSEQNIIRKKYYLPNENVILYIPYNESTSNKNVIYLKKIEFDSSFSSALFYALFLIPAIFLFFIWFIFGRDKHNETPSQLSMIPNESNKRKPWQIAAFFNPPFGDVDKNLFAGTILDFYYKKIIDIKIEKKDWSEKMFIKINNYNIELDNIENQVLEILKVMEKKSGEFFELKANFMDSFKLKSKGKKLQKDVKKESEEFVSTLGISIITIISYLCFYFVFFILSGFGINISLILLMIIGIVGIIFLAKTTAIFSKHKKDYYREYLHWQAFKKYLKNSFSIKNATHKTIVMWEEYLIYATALGVPKRVIKELESAKLITATQAKMYTGIYVHSSTFATSSGASSSGGHGGAGGGGVGGGGGGGR